MTLAITLAENRLIPDWLIRVGIKRLLRARLADEARRHRERDEALQVWTDHMRTHPVALVPELANEQHYEVPADFFEAVLGPHLKYSSACWPPGTVDLAQAEATMLELTASRAELADGQRVLELGCGWGSLTLWMASRYPRSRIVAVSNSHSQRQLIEQRARERGLDNVEVITADINGFEATGVFDRIVSVEMFEHVRNWEELLGRCRRWIDSDGGKLFLHVFAHRDFAYPFETTAKDDWMGRNFFTGGMMPSADLIDRLTIPFVVTHRWTVDGTHYQRTAEAWADNLQQHRAALVSRFAADVGVAEARRIVQRWHIFFRACSELFGYDSGKQWLVCHYLLSPRDNEVPS